MPAPRATPDLPAPALAVVLPTDSWAAVRKTLHCFRIQGDPARLEIVVVALGRTALDPAAEEARGFPFLRIVPVDTAIDLGAAELAAFRTVTAPFVVFAESCGHPLPGYVDAMLAAARTGRWAAIGPALVSANPGSATGWAAMWINYTRWAETDAPGAVDLLPGHNTVFACDRIRALGAEADGLLASLTALQLALRARGGALGLEPAARVALLNVSRPGVFLVDQLGKGRQYATYRCRSWSRARRLAYALGAPAIPVVRLARIGATLRRRGRLGAVWHGGRVAMLCAGLVAGAAGELAGYLVGGPTPPGFYARILHRPRFVRPADARADADESRWPR